MIGLDTNLLARFYVDDPNDPEAAKQRPVARRILTESPHLFVPLDRRAGAGRGAAGVLRLRRC